MNRHLDFLLSCVYDNSALHPEHLADLRRSGLTDETIATHKVRTVPPAMIDQLLGFHMPNVRSACLFPFPTATGGFADYVKMKVFSDVEADDIRGDEIEEHEEKWRYNGGQRKYLVRRQAAPRLYFPIPTMGRALDSTEPVWVVEGMKKALSVMQLGLPVVGFESPFSWHLKGSTALLPDFTLVKLAGRIVELVPDSDIQTNSMIAGSMRRFADALRAAGARPRLVRLPEAIRA